MYVQTEGMYTVDASVDRNICLNGCMSGFWLLHSAQWACLVKQCVVWNHTVGQGCKMLHPAPVSEATLLRTWRKSQFHISTGGRWKASCGICKGNRTLYSGLNPAMNKNKENLNFNVKVLYICLRTQTCECVVLRGKMTRNVLVWE